MQDQDGQNNDIIYHCQLIQSSGLDKRECNLAHPICLSDAVISTIVCIPGDPDSNIASSLSSFICILISKFYFSILSNRLCSSIHRYTCVRLYTCI